MRSCGALVSCPRRHPSQWMGSYIPALVFASSSMPRRYPGFFFSFLFFLFTYIWYYPLMDPAGGFPASTDQPRPFCFFLACMLCSRVRTSRGRGTRHGFVLFSRIVCSTASLALCTLRTQLPSVTKVADGYMPCGACYEIIIASQQGKQLMA
jgi:energy-coupling factor transporter transmembrane protein EcfT